MKGEPEREMKVESERERMKWCVDESSCLLPFWVVSISSPLLACCCLLFFLLRCAACGMWRVATKGRQEDGLGKLCSPCKAKGAPQ